MSHQPENPRGQPQSELDHEQAVVDLDQGIADREQARADRDQEPLDAAQLALDADIASAAPGPAVVTVAQSERQADIGLAQERRDVHQAQLDGNQRAQGARQDVLDDQQAVLDAHVAPDAEDIEVARARAAEELQQALRTRAEVTLARAEDARQRAADALARLEASEVRRRQRDEQG